MSPLEDIIDRLERTRRSGASWVAQCPAHEDRHPSLSVRATDDGAVLVFCHAGCSTTDVLAALGLTFRDLYPEASMSRHDPHQPTFEVLGWNPYA